jgi:hypothetical protein
LALSTFVGPFGAIHRREPWVQPIYQECDADMVYPIFHVIRFLSGMGGAARLSLAALENGIVGVASREASHIRLMLANLGAYASHVRLPHKAEVRFLNARSFLSAIKDPQWLDTSEPDHVSDVALEPFGVAFLNMPA